MSDNSGAQVENKQIPVGYFWSYYTIFETVDVWMCLFVVFQTFLQVSFKICRFAFNNSILKRFS